MLFILMFINCCYIFGCDYFDAKLHRVVVNVSYV